MDPRFIDYPFEHKTLLINGEQRVPGCLPRPDKFAATFPAFHEAFPRIPRSEWPDRVAQLVPIDVLLQEVKDQDGEGSCTSNASSACLESILVKQLGPEKFVRLSAMSLYKQCGDSPNSGSSLSCNLAKLIGIGVLPSNKPENIQRCKSLGLEIPDEHFFPDIGFRTRYPDGWKDTASLFRADEAWDLESYDDLVSAIIYGFAVVYARAGHCILAVGLRYDGNRLYVIYLNSWGNWGDPFGHLTYGVGYDSESAVKSGLGYGLYVVRTTRLPEVLMKV